MKIQLTVTTDDNISVATMTVEVSKLAYKYIERILTFNMEELFWEEANGLPHAGKPKETL